MPTKQPRRRQSSHKYRVGSFYIYISSTFSSTLLTSDLPAIDNELLPLLDFSSPSLSSNASIVERFDRIAEHLFQRSCLVCCSTKRDGAPKRVLYELLEFEFYLIKPECHSDPFTHDGQDQRLSGAWSVQCFFKNLFFCIMKPNFCPDCKVLPSRPAAQRSSHLGSSCLPWRLSKRTRLDNRNSQLPGFPERPTRSNSRRRIAADPPKGLRFNRHIRSFPAGRRIVAVEWCRRHPRTCQ